MKIWQKWFLGSGAGVCILAVSSFVALSARNIASDMTTLATSDMKTYQSDALQQYEDTKQKQVNQYALWMTTQATPNTAKTPEADNELDENAFIMHSVPAVYYIQPGDTLTKISAQVLYSVDELADYNKIRDVNLIYANSVLRVPD